MNNSTSTPAADIIGIVKNLQTEKDGIYKDELQGDQERLRLFASHLFVHFPAIASHLLSQESQLKIAVGALEEIAEPQIHSVKPVGDGKYSVMTIEYASWEREIAKNALSRLSP